MSAVATLNALPPRGKRHFDEMAVDYTPPPVKRARKLVAHRYIPSTSSSSSDDRMADREKTPPPPSTPTITTASSVPTAAQLDALSALSHHIPRRLRRTIVSKLQSGDLTFEDKMFSSAEVVDIVRSVVAERETNLHEQFTSILNDRLAEQFKDFTRFNQDYVKNTLRGKDESYLS